MTRFSMREPNRDVMQALRRNQANAMVLYQNYKKYHWFTYGPQFHDLPLLLDEHAERAIILDGEAIGDPCRAR